MGVYHAPGTASESERGVVLCYPFGQEYMRSHRAFRQLAVLLARSGHHVLRFDYYGTGDSMGDSVDGSLEEWVGDIETAVEELRAMTGVSQVSLVGLRLGASMACIASTFLTPPADELVLWDPVVCGDDYLAELEQVADPVPATGPEPETKGVAGFPLTPALRRGIAGVDLHRLEFMTSARAAIFASKPAFEDARLRTRLEQFGMAVSSQVIDSRSNWVEYDEDNESLLPHAMIQGIVTAVSGQPAS